MSDLPNESSPWRGTDRIDRWFDAKTAARLQAAGLLLLQDLQQRMATGGTWWQTVPAIGRIKAGRITRQLQQQLPEALASPGRAFATIHAHHDAEGIEAWVAARAGSAATASSYRREARRLLIWLNQARARGFADTTVDDCQAYMRFLGQVPPDWSSRRHAGVMGPGWAPFRGPLSPASRRQAAVILAGFFSWRVETGHLPLRNPWLRVTQRTGEAPPAQGAAHARAFSHAAWAALQHHLAAQAPCPSRHRIEFVLGFVEATGLGAAELLAARLSAFHQHQGRWTMQVHGSGARHRVIAVPAQAVRALNAYLASRRLPPLGKAPGDAPLLASALDPMAPIRYQALYKTMRRWVFQAIVCSALPRGERDAALRASPHWLRHTFGTRALERQAPLDVVQRQLGHADPRSTLRYARVRPGPAPAEIDRAFDGQGTATPADLSGPR